MALLTDSPRLAISPYIHVIIVWARHGNFDKHCCLLLTQYYDFAWLLSMLVMKVASLTSIQKVISGLPIILYYGSLSLIFNQTSKDSQTPATMVQSPNYIYSNTWAVWQKKNKYPYKLCGTHGNLATTTILCDCIQTPDLWWFISVNCDF